jgi:hypothetical protein
LAEEHLLIKDARGNDWVVGTTLDYGEKCTKVNIFNVSDSMKKWVTKQEAEEEVSE